MHKVAGLGYLFISMWPYGANQIAVFVHPANQQQVVYPIRETLCKPMKLQYLCIQPIRDQHPGFPNGIAVLSIPNRKPCVSSSCSTRGVSDTLGNGSIALCPSKIKPWIHTGSFPLLWQLSRVGIEGCFSVGLMLSQTRDLVQDFEHVVYSKEGTLSLARFPNSDTIPVAQLCVQLCVTQGRSLGIVSHMRNHVQILFIHNMIVPCITHCNRDATLD